MGDPTNYRNELKICAESLFTTETESVKIFLVRRAGIARAQVFNHRNPLKNNKIVSLPKASDLKKKVERCLLTMSPSAIRNSLKNVPQVPARGRAGHMDGMRVQKKNQVAPSSPNSLPRAQSAELSLLLANLLF